MPLAALDDARRHAGALLERCRAGRSLKAGIGNVLAASGGGATNTMSRQQHMNMASEQYRHFVGWTHAIIRIIAQRIASQPVRVARPVGEQEVRRLQGIVLKRSKAPGWQKAVAAKRLRGIALGRMTRSKMPAFVKNYHRELEVVEDHPILRAFDRPNPLMVRWVLGYLTVCHLELTGRCYYWFTGEDQIDFENPGNGLQIWPLPTSWVEPVHDDKKLFSRWIITPPGGGSTVTVPGDEIAHIYYPDPANPLGCVSTLQAQSRAVVVDEATLEAQRRSMANGLYPGMAIVVGRDPDVAGGMRGARPVLTREQRAQIVQAMKASYRGVQNADEPVILDGLIEDIKPITTKPKEMDFTESGKVSKERLSQGWGVNPISMGQLEGANRASSHTADGHLVVNAINPRIEMISEFYTRHLPAAFSGRGASGDEIVYLEKAEVIDVDSERENMKVQIEQGCLTRNELRQFYGRTPIKGGDSCFVPVNNLQLIPIEREDAVLFDNGEPTDEIGTND